MFSDLDENLKLLKEAYSDSADLTVRMLCVPGGKSVRLALITLEGMISGSEAAQAILNPILSFRSASDYKNLTGEALYNFIFTEVISGSETAEEATFNSAISKLNAGFAVLFIDGCAKAISIGIQGYQFRSVSEPQNEAVQRGSQEGFIEPIKPNMGLLRRRLPTPDLVFENVSVGTEVESKLCLAYLKSKASPSILRKLRSRLAECNLSEALASGYLVEYLEDNSKSSLFSGVGVTERPDVAAGKLSEGRIAIIVDGSPSVLIVPHLFIEEFQSFDDYTTRPYYAGFVRLLKYFAFAVSVLLPGIFTAIVNFHPQLLPENILAIIASSAQKTPLPLTVEVVFIYILYEVTREAALRVPKPLSQTIGIIGGLVIGDAAVSAGLIGSFSLVIVALSAVCAFAVPDLYGVCTVLRLAFVFAGGIMGLWGISLAFFVLVIMLCTKTSFGVPYMSPIAPLDFKSMQDVFIRAGWKRLSRNPVKIQDMTGVEE